MVMTPQQLAQRDADDLLIKFDEELRSRGVNELTSPEDLEDLRAAEEAIKSGDRRKFIKGKRVLEKILDRKFTTWDEIEL